MTNQELIEKAKSVVRPKQIRQYMVGDVGCALLTDQDHLFLGVCIDVGSSMGFCAEHSAIGAMVTAGEFRIKKIVAVWKDDKNTYILAPCGRCREFIRQIDESNLETEVILDIDRAVRLAELLPSYGWFHKIEAPLS
ncbi:MAG: cytidine deaminase family protein [Omnitrophica WOR_2 bacterium]